MIDIHHAVEVVSNRTQILDVEQLSSGHLGHRIIRVMDSCYQGTKALLMTETSRIIAINIIVLTYLIPLTSKCHNFVLDRVTANRLKTRCFINLAAYGLVGGTIFAFNRYALTHLITHTPLSSFMLVGYSVAAVTLYYFMKTKSNHKNPEVISNRAGNIPPVVDTRPEVRTNPEATISLKAKENFEDINTFKEVLNPEWIKILKQWPQHQMMLKNRNELIRKKLRDNTNLRKELDEANATIASLRKANL